MNTKTEAVLISSTGDDSQMRDMMSSRDTAYDDHQDGIPISTPQNYSPVSSSSVSIASSSSGDSDMTHTQHAENEEHDTDLERTNSLGLTGHAAPVSTAESGTDAFPNIARRRPFAFDDEEDRGNPLSREKTPRAHETPSIRSLDTQGILVPSSHASSVSVTPNIEHDDPTGASVVKTDTKLAAPRKVTEKELRDDVEIAGMSSIGTLLLGAPIQT
jgi:hypothetical protein